MLSLRLIRNCALHPDEAIIDVGGGASLLVDRLLAEGYRRLAVLDISACALALAEVRLGERADVVEWFEADITEFFPPHPFSLWHDRAVFHFLTEAEERGKYVEILHKTLRPGGHLILAAFAIGAPTQCSGLNIVQYDAQKLLRELGGQFELIEDLGERHVTPSGKEQLFSYFRLTRR